MKSSRLIRVDCTFEKLLKKVKIKIDMPIVKQTKRLGESLTPSELINLLNNKKQQINRRKEFNPFR